MRDFTSDVQLTRRAAVAAACFALAAAPLAAQERRDPTDTARLQPVVVTATRTPLPLSRAPVSVTVLSGDELRAQGVSRVADALRQVPGVALAQNGSTGSATSLFLRGGERDYVKVLVDGVPVNDPGGDYDFANLTTDDVDRIEVLRGPGSVLYGSDAVTGVIQIFTRRGRRPEASLEVRGGSYGAREGRADAAGSAGPLSFSAGGSARRTDGTLAFNDAYRDDAVAGQLRFTPSRRADVALTGRYTEGTFHFPTDFAGAQTDSNQFTRERRVSAGLDAGYRLAPALEARVLLSDSRSALLSDNRPDSPGDTSDFYSRANADRYRRGADVRVNARVAGSVVTVGGAYEAERESSRGTSTFGTTPLPPSAFDQRRLNRAAYSELVSDLPAGATVTLGGRYDDNERFGVFRTGRAALSVPVAGRVRVRGAAGNAFKEPAFGEQFDTPFSTGNPGLRPERTRSYEGGVDATLVGALTAGATYFSERFDDMVQYDAGAAPGTPNYVNLGAARAAGVEIELRARPVRGLGASAQYAYTATRVVDGGGAPSSSFVTGEALLRRPTRTAAATIDYRAPRVGTLALTVSHVGSRDDRDFTAFPARPVVLSAYTTLDVGAAVDVPAPRRAPALAVTARVENALGRKYQSIYGYDAPGRVVLVGARVSVGR